MMTNHHLHKMMKSEIGWWLLEMLGNDKEVLFKKLPKSSVLSLGWQKGLYDLVRALTKKALFLGQFWQPSNVRMSYHFFLSLVCLFELTIYNDVKEKCDKKNDSLCKEWFPHSSQVRGLGPSSFRREEVVEAFMGTPPPPLSSLKSRRIFLPLLPGPMKLWKKKMGEVSQIFPNPACFPDTSHEIFILEQVYGRLWQK